MRWFRRRSGWRTSAARRASSPGRCAGGRSSSTRRAAARWPASTSCTRCSRPIRPTGRRRPSCTATTGWTTGLSGPMASYAPGYPSVPEVLDLYAAASGRDLSDLGFYIALASFKAAVILEGIHFRYVHGQTVGEGFEEIGSLVEPLVASGLAAISQALFLLRVRQGKSGGLGKKNKAPEDS